MLFRNKTKVFYIQLNYVWLVYQLFFDTAMIFLERCLFVWCHISIDIKRKVMNEIYSIILLDCG